MIDERVRSLERAARAGDTFAAERAARERARAGEALPVVWKDETDRDPWWWFSRIAQWAEDERRFGDTTEFSVVLGVLTVTRLNGMRLYARARAAYGLSLPYSVITIE